MLEIVKPSRDMLCLERLVLDVKGIMLAGSNLASASLWLRCSCQT